MLRRSLQRRRRHPVTAFSVFRRKHRAAAAAAAVERQHAPCDRPRSVAQITADWWHALATDDKLPYHQMALKVDSIIIVIIITLSCYMTACQPLTAWTYRSVPNFVYLNF